MAAKELPAGGVTPPLSKRNSISRRQIEIVIARSAAVFGLAFGAQTLPALAQESLHPSPIASGMAVAVFGGLLAAVIAAALKRGVRAVNAYIAVAWLVAMAAWPLTVIDPTVEAAHRPWLWYLTTVATTAAAVAWPIVPATIALAVAPLTYGIVRITPPGGDASPTIAALDVMYAVILGGATLLIITLLRQAAAAVDLAQAAALDRYETAVGRHATEVERVQVDAIVHDSVLTTLLSSARARTPRARALAAAMATTAMGHLRDAAASTPDDDALVAASDVAERMRVAAASVGAKFTVRIDELHGADMPVQAAEAVYSAAVQSMVNSAQHAGPRSRVSRSLRVSGVPGGGIAVEVRDTGAGFDPISVPRERIGVRVSIIERVANAGGDVDIESAPGAGTVVRIRWPRAGTA